MSITWPTREQLVEKFLAWHRVFFPNTSTAERSDAWLEGQGVGGIGGIILARVRSVYNDIFPSTASTDGLTRHGENWLPADKRWQLATGTTSGQLRAFGTPGAIPANTEFVHADGTKYYNPAVVTVADWGGAPWIDFNVLSSDTGVICNKAVDAVLNFVSPIAGIMSEVYVTTALEGARDDETDDEYRARILGWHHYPPGGGNFGHYKAFAEGVGGCAKAYVYPMFRGLGTVDVVCLGAGRSDDAYVGSRFSADEDEVYNELIEEVRPCTADLGDLPSVGPTVAITDPVAQFEDIDVTITPASGYEGDWGGGYTAVNPMPSTSKVTLTVDPTGTILVGMRVLLNVWDGAAWHPCVREVSAVGNPWIEVTEAFPGTVPDVVAGGLQPAGAGSLAMVEALLDLFDALTPGDTVVASRRPIVGPDDPTDLLLADIFDALQSLESVANVVITTPAADTAPAAAKDLITNGRFYVDV